MTNQTRRDAVLNRCPDFKGIETENVLGIILR